MLLEQRAFSRSETAAILGFSDSHLGTLIERHNLFQDRRRGRGHHLAFGLRDLFQLGAIKALIDAGMETRQACEALSSYSIYGCFLHDRYNESVFPLARNSEGRWVGMDGPNFAVTINIKTRAIWQAIRKGLERLSSSDSGADNWLANALTDADQKINELEKMTAPKPLTIEMHT